MCIRDRPKRGWTRTNGSTTSRPSQAGRSAAKPSTMCATFSSTGWRITSRWTRLRMCNDPRRECVSKSRTCCVSTLLFAVSACLTLAACVAPLVPYSTDTPPLVLAPAAQAGVIDERARFREIYCAVLEARRGLPDYRPVSYTHLRAHETPEHLVCRLLLEK